MTIDAAIEVLASLLASEGSGLGTAEDAAYDRGCADAVVAMLEIDASPEASSAMLVLARSRQFKRE